MAKKCTKKCDASANLCFANRKPIIFFSCLCCRRRSLLKLPIVVIQKFCYHGDMTSHFSSLCLRVDCTATKLRDVSCRKIAKQDNLPFYWCLLCSFIIIVYY